MSNITVSGLFVYPIKGARGIEVSSARVTPLGLEYDRRFLLVDSHGYFLTQREHPKLALVRTAIEDETLTIEAPDQEALQVPLRPTGGAERMVQVWETRSRAISVGQTHADYFSRYLGTPVELVFMPDDHGREVDPDYAKDGERVSFADGFPFLLTTEESLSDLNARLTQSVGWDRFRPNIVVRGAPPWAEDTWTTLSNGNVVFYFAKPCPRCQVTTIDQKTGARGKDPLATLATFRSRANKVDFGWNLLAKGTGEIRTGERLNLST
ncbi:MAG TPA: MOSC N-terminal beta barrel domain-containing protein [Polyangium sp.]|nr:MOSC N-terminal beta barrel domain-containing protein [Polyangium sp.]